MRPYRMLCCLLLGTTLPLVSAEDVTPQILTNRAGMRFVTLQPTPQHSLEPFSLQTTELTEQQYANIMYQSGHWDITKNACPTHPTLAKDSLSWKECQELARILSRLDPNATYRLPTVQEWEFAFRAGGDGIPRYSHPSRAKVDGVSARHLVLRNPPNALGLYGLEYGLGEYCSDRFLDVAGETYQGPAGASSRVVKGLLDRQKGFASCLDNHPINQDGDELEIRVGVRFVMIPNRSKIEK